MLFRSKALDAFNGTITIRHVMVPGLTDAEKVMDELLAMILPLQKKIDKIDILPYHKAGIEKYSQLNLAYTFETVPAMSSEKAMAFEADINVKLSALKAQQMQKTA